MFDYFRYFEIYNTYFWKLLKQLSNLYIYLFNSVVIYINLHCQRKSLKFFPKIVYEFGLSCFWKQYIQVLINITSKFWVKFFDSSLCVAGCIYVYFRYVLLNCKHYPIFRVLKFKVCCFIKLCKNLNLSSGFVTQALVAVILMSIHVSFFIKSLISS